MMEDPILAELSPAVRAVVQAGHADLSPDGAVRYLTGSGHPAGSIAGWLRPTGMAVSEAAAAMLPQLTLGLVAVNTVVTAVGFAVMYRKLNRIESTIGRIDRRLDRFDSLLNEIQKELRSVSIKADAIRLDISNLKENLLRDLQQFKLGEVFGAVKSLAESIVAVRREEAIRRVDACDRRCHEAIHLAETMPVEAMPFRVPIFRLAILGRCLICRAYLENGEIDTAKAFHAATLRNVREVAAACFGSKTLFLGTAPTVYLLEDIMAFHPMAQDRPLETRYREQILDFALAPTYPLTADGQRVPKIRKQGPVLREDLCAVGNTMRLTMGTDVQVSIEAEAADVLDHAGEVARQYAWNSVLLPYEVTAVERALEQEEEILDESPDLLLKLASGGEDHPVAFVPCSKR